MQYPFITYGMALCKRQYADKTLTLRKTICERAERASLENLFQYLVGTLDNLLVQMTYLSAYLYQQISKCTAITLKKHYGGIAPLAALGDVKKSRSIDAVAGCLSLIIDKVDKHEILLRIITHTFVEFS